MSPHNITIPLHGPPISSPTNFFTRNALHVGKVEEKSQLLRSIHFALRGTETDLVSCVRSTVSITTEEMRREEELTWNAHTVILGSGGVIFKRWNFEEEGQTVQWACSGWLMQTDVTTVNSQSATHRTQAVPASSTQSAPQRPTFGPFSRASQDRKHTEQSSRYPAVFIFLRSIGKVFLRNGLDYTFSLPFIVRKAWPLFPHGVMIQRVLDPTEMEDSEVTGDAVLPTIFSVTSPFSEAAVVGLTAGIVGALNEITPSLKDEEENSAKPLKSIPPTETVVWASHRDNETTDDVLVTVDTERHQLSIWRYVYMKPKDTPISIGRTRARSMARKRQSLSNVLPNTRRHSGVFNETTDHREPLHRFSSRAGSCERSLTPEFPELPPLSALPGMPPSLSTTTTMSSLTTGKSSLSQWPTPRKGRRNSLTRNDLSVTMDRMVLGGKMEVDANTAPIEHGRMKAAYWMEKLYSQEISEVDTLVWATISAALFDQRWDGKSDRSLMAICLPATETLALFTLTHSEDRTLKVTRLPSLSAISVVSIRATRHNVSDLLIVKPDNQLAILTHGLCELALNFSSETSTAILNNSLMEVDAEAHGRPVDPLIKHGGVVAVQDAALSSVTLCLKDGWMTRTNINLMPEELLTCQSLQILALSLPPEYYFALHRSFLGIWSSRGLSTCRGVEFESFTEALYKTFDLQEVSQSKFVPVQELSWHTLPKSQSHRSFQEDVTLKKLNVPSCLDTSGLPRCSRKPHKYLAPILHALHTLGEDIRLMTYRYESLLRLAPVICRIALIIRPEWADYWKRLCSDAIPTWPSPATTVIDYLDDRIPVWPPDISAILYGRISNPDWKVPWHDAHHLTNRSETAPSFAYGRLEPLATIHELTTTYKCLADSKVEGTQKRAENTVQLMVKSPIHIDHLPLGIAAPLREAARTCQLSPPGDWPLDAYRAVGRNDLAACAADVPDMLFNDGYRTVKDYINPSSARRSISDLISEARAAGAGEIDGVSGVELDLEEFTNIRFGQDRRLEEVSRMLCSSAIPSVRLMERPELSEHDQAKEQQHQVVRIAERTLALPYGRAMFTFGSVHMVTRQAYAIPKLDYSIRIQPLNIIAAPEPGKIPQECLHWGEFHNGVAAGLRLSPSCTAVEGSWITFNKPSELTPEHAGFLFGLGLTGHLKEMLTWHTFAYLTPKHDLTSIGVLLGLSAANFGNGNRHVTKLLAVHTPALLPTPTVDLNVSLMTQAAGLAGVGLLYLGTRNRHMAEVCLNQISRGDLVQPDLSNEHREAYTYSAALAFGMIMLGKGSLIPADTSLFLQLTLLIHGDVDSFLEKKSRCHFDINLTSPAATIALGLMYLKTERQDVADVLTIPDTVLALNRIQPSFLLLRTLARSLIMWNSVAPTNEWLTSQVPRAIVSAIDARFQGKPVDDAFELAYYNILAGCCFVIGLKYAGTARQEAYLMIISYFDLFSRLVYSNGPAFDHRIKRSAVREGLNLISIALCMVMAGTGEITCFRRLRYAYGLYHQAFRYGIHVATHMSLGLLFLGGGRFTLGTSDAAIACMITAFFPRFHHISSDNKSYLQALRHLWVLAIEPRCLIARDVDSMEVVYLPVKITMKEGNDVGATQLISPTLIPDLDKLLSIRVDTPRYWPFYLDTENIPSHKAALLRSQTLYVKRRTAFLSYTEDPRGSRSMFVRSGSSAGDAATLDYPQLTETKTHPAGDLSQFITSFSNDILFLAFADHFSRDDGETSAEQLLHTYCHATLLDSILQDKPRTLQSHLILYRYRIMSPSSRYFHLNVQDLRFATDFYNKIYERRFSGRSENNARPPLIRETTVSGVLHVVDRQLNTIRTRPWFLTALGQYARGEVVEATHPAISIFLGWYLLRNGVPVSTLLEVLCGLAREAHMQCLGLPTPEGTSDAEALDRGIKEVLHGTGTKMTTALGSGWSVRSLDEIVDVWKIV